MKQAFKTLKGLEKAVRSGRKFHWENSLYDIKWDRVYKCLICVCNSNDYTTGVSEKCLKRIYEVKVK